MSSRMHLILNRRFSTVRCLACGKLLISSNVHDCRVCGCAQATSVDGGPAYLRCGGAQARLPPDSSSFEMGHALPPF